MAKPQKKLGDGELDVMLAVWESGRPVTGSEIQARVQEKRTWPMSTLMTVLARLVEKGYLACDRSTGTNLYRALVEEKTYKEQESRSFLNRMHRGSLPGLVACLYESGGLKKEDLEELRQFLEQAQEEE